MAYRCAVCRAELVERPGRATCSFCGCPEPTDWACPAGHHACEACRTATAEELVVRVAAAAGGTDPVAIAERILAHPAFGASGPEHHAVPAAAVLAALRNAGRWAATPADLAEAVRRTSDVPLGACGSRGDCGACVGAGVAVAIALRADHRAAPERALVLRAAARALARLAELGGVRCCKQAVYAALEAATATLAEARGWTLTAAPTRCPFAPRNPECQGAECPYHG